MATKTASAPLPAVRATSFFASRRWLGQIAAGVVVLVLVGAFALNRYLSDTYGPEGTATAYLNAIAAGDASTAWSLITLGGTADRATVDLATQQGIRAQLLNPATRGVDAGSVKLSSGRNASSGYEVIASYRSGGKATQQTLSLSRDASAKHFLFYPAWHVYVRPALVQLALPPGSGAVSVDRLPIPAGTKTLAVLPGLHTVTVAATSLYEGLQTVGTVQSGDGFTPTTITLQPKVSAVAQAAAVAAVKDAFSLCQKGSASDAFWSMNCPNTFRNFQVVRDPADGVSLYVGADGALYAQGHSALVDGGEMVGGPFTAKLDATTSQLKVVNFITGSAAKPVPPLARPNGINDDAVRSAVGAAMRACAAMTGLSQSGCPQSLDVSAVGDVHNLQWTSNSDPMSGATVTWDGDYGLFRANGAFDMSVAFDETIVGHDFHYSYHRTGNYKAWVAADGSSPRVVRIDRA